MATQVHPVIEGWGVSVAREGNTGVKVFVDAANSAAAVALPAIGDAFSSEFPLLTCTSITYSYLPGDGSCGRKYTVQYATPPLPESDPEDSSALPMSLSVAANIRSIECGKERWYWESDRSFADADLQLPVRDWNMAITISRWVYANKLDNFNSVVLAAVGKINSVLWRGFPPNTVQFVGSEAQEYPTNSSGKRWLAQLRFVARRVEWDKVWRADTGDFDRPLFNGSDPIYESSTFADLFSTDKNVPVIT